MRSELRGLFSTSVFRKQMVAVTGLMLVLFVLVHLAGNFLLFAGLEIFNGYAKKLRDWAELLWLARLVLIAAFVTHVYHTIRLTLENRRAHGRGYALPNTKGDQGFAKRTMVFSGLLVFLFLLLHLVDYTFGDKEGSPSVIHGLNNNESLGLFGLVWNSFLLQEHWWRPVLYILAVSAVGMHVSHGIQSVFQSVGFHHERYMPLIIKMSLIVGVTVALGYAAIPICVNILGTPSI